MKALRVVTVGSPGFCVERLIKAMKQIATDLVIRYSNHAELSSNISNKQKG